MSTNVGIHLHTAPPTNPERGVGPGTEVLALSVDSIESRHPVHALVDIGFDRSLSSPDRSLSWESIAWPTGTRF